MPILLEAKNKFNLMFIKKKRDHVHELALHHKQLSIHEPVSQNGETKGEPVKKGRNKTISDIYSVFLSYLLSYAC